MNRIKCNKMCNKLIARLETDFFYCSYAEFTINFLRSTILIELIMLVLQRP